jgi:hypothetical protein
MSASPEPAPSGGPLIDGPADPEGNEFCILRSLPEIGS